MANASAPISAMARRRWLRYSLRTLMVLVTVLCVWLAIKVNAARRRADVVAAIQKAGTVWFDYQLVPAKAGNGINVGSGLSVDPNAHKRRLHGCGTFLATTSFAARFRSSSLRPRTSFSRTSINWHNCRS